jgi:dipeptidyl aminopeptidase/acylaminoacyl peptidase
MIRAAFLALLALIATTAAAAAQSTPPVERHPGLRVEQVSLRAADGVMLRALVTRPKATNQKLPAILFVQWL